MQEEISPLTLTNYLRSLEDFPGHFARFQLKVNLPLQTTLQGDHSHVLVPTETALS